MTRWQYCHAIVQRRDGAGLSQVDHPHPDDVDAVLNRYGADGWELVQQDGSILRFKREIPEDG